MVKAQIAHVASDFPTTLTRFNVVPDVSSVDSEVLAISSNLSRVQPKIAAIGSRSVVISACARGRLNNSRNLC